jgi:uncharacterized membrane-anchored protein
MILNYDISTPPISSGKQWKPGAEVFVVLEKKGQYHEAIGVSIERPSIESHQKIVRGKIDDHWRSRITYGIERYFVPEGKGTPSFTNMVVQVAVDPQEKLNIKKLILDGKPYP